MGQHKAFPYTLDPEQIPTRKNLDVTDSDGPTVCYACPDSCWREHFDAWRKEWQKGNKVAPQPQPWGHCMFSDPAAYGQVAWADRENVEAIRKAWDSHFRGTLDGWGDELKKTKTGLERLEAIIKAAVDAKMSGKEPGASPYLACLLADI